MHHVRGNTWWSGSQHAQGKFDTKKGQDKVHVISIPEVFSLRKVAREIKARISLRFAQNKSPEQKIC